MVDLIVEQAAIQSGYDYWTIDLKENDLDFSPQSLKDKFIGEEVIYSGYKFKIQGIEFYSLRKDKIVLITVKDKSL